MSKRVEIKIESETPTQRDEREFQHSRVDLNGLCKEMNLRWFSFKECFTCHKHELDCSCKKDGKQDLRVVYFIHEVGYETGAKFTRKRDMADQMVSFWAAWAAFNMDLVTWAGRRGLRIVTTMSEEDRKKVQAQRAALEAMKEASKAGEMVNIEAGVAPMSEVSL